MIIAPIVCGQREGEQRQSGGREVALKWLVSSSFLWLLADKTFDQPARTARTLLVSSLSCDSVTFSLAIIINSVHLCAARVVNTRHTAQPSKSVHKT